MKIGYYQFKPEFLKPANNIEKISANLADKSFDLIVLPELSNSGYLFTDIAQLKQSAESPENGAFCEGLKNIAKTKNAYIVCGFCELGVSGEYYNSSILVKPDGSFSIYRKIHLFSEEPVYFQKGNLPLEVIEITGNFGSAKIGMMICFDWAFPEVTRTLTLKGAQIICHPSNLVMPYCQQTMYARAVENGVFIITTNRIGTEKNFSRRELTFTGSSVLLSTRGNYISRASVIKEEIFITDINPADADNKFINPYNNLITDRRPEFYIN